MTIKVNKKVPCPKCGQPKLPASKTCRKCCSYAKTDAWREQASKRQRGQKHYWESGSKRPEVAEKIRAWWTPERRAERKAKAALLHLDSPYHGLSSGAAKRLREAVGKCEKCGMALNLDIHHRNRIKQDHSLSNLIVLCHKCHMKDHSSKQEMGWALYHKRLNQTSSVEK